MKTDLRIRYTRKVIREAFLKLLKEKPLARITVKEVCDLAQINRGTFYKHYLDCYDLMDKLQDEAAANFEALLDNLEENGIENVIVAILEKLRSDSGINMLVNSQSQSDGFYISLLAAATAAWKRKSSAFRAWIVRTRKENTTTPFCSAAAAV